jgi:hypothetical protein
MASQQHIGGVNFNFEQGSTMEQNVNNEDIPIKQITLYKHGVAFIQHEGNSFACRS